MAKNKFGAKKFQECTVNKVIKEILESKRLPRRFLVADEVGLGKTIVAKHVIDHLRKQGGKKIIVYVSSSLDITKQNRIKLAIDPEKEIVQADRVNLLYLKGALDNGLQIVTMTPGTSLSLERSLGSAQERCHIADIVRTHYRLNLERLTNLFKGTSHFHNFYNSLEQKVTDKSKRRAFLPHIEEPICKRWENIWLSNGMSFSEALRDERLTPEIIRELVLKMRKEMAIGILESLRPKLVIFDEFQKFRDLTEINDDGTVEHGLARILLKEETPTLLLSATPYKLFSVKQDFSEGDCGHYQDLQKTFSFLTGSTKKATGLVTDIQKYGIKVLKLKKENLKDVLSSKAAIEAEVMQFMSRTERINFGDPRLSITSKFLSEKFDGGHVTKENFLEFFRLAKYSESKGQLLTYWKSGSHSMSYLGDYKLIKNAVERSEESNSSLSSERSLYSKFGHHPSQHIKLKYLYDDVFKNGKSFDYLWIPASRPYYKGAGVFSDDALNESGPRKGLVFSSWKFVPRLTAAEINSLKEHYFRRVTKAKLQPSAEGLAKLFFPSTFLATIVTQADFLAATNFSNIFHLTREKIKTSLLNLGYRLVSSSRGMPIATILSDLEFRNDVNNQSKYKNILKGRSYRLLNSDNERSADFSKIHFFQEFDERFVGQESIDTLAKIALSSPAVCLLRAILLLKETALSNHSWLQLAAFCLHDIRHYVGREANMQVFVKNGKGSKPLDKVLDYFKSGNIQAVWDEYLYLTYLDKVSDQGVEEVLVRLAHIFAPTKSSVKIQKSPKIKQRISTDIACCFGEGEEESNSRDTNREAFNSPFWPFLLSTTSVGQEGLDFHLYCKDIYHWNLPSNPVDFEQREGRLNRFNNFAIRKNIMKNGWAEAKDLENGKHFWSYCFAKAKDNAHRNDRYSLGMSPNWIYTPMLEGIETINRHVMDMPCSNDYKKYQKLMDDLSFYRLALGQPDQKEFIKKLQENDSFKDVNVRSVTLDFFPSKERDNCKEIEEYLKDRNLLNILIEDSLSHLAELKDLQMVQELKKEVERHVTRIKLYLDESKGTKESYRRSIEALYYFMDPFDQISDRNPLHGFKDDLKKLKAA